MKKTKNTKQFCKIIIFLVFLLFYLIKYFLLKKNNKYIKNSVTLVSALFKIKSKYSFSKYLMWVQNLLKINCSLIFFVDKRISNYIKKKRPKIFENKTVLIETSINDFYSYKHFKKNFINSYKIDHEKSYHTVPLYLVWAEKCYFLKKAIKYNYFNSECFYWIDAGYFRNKENKLIENWPSNKKCYEDPRVLINSIRNPSNNEIEGIKKFNYTIYSKFFKKANVGGGLFGGKSKNLIKFIHLYYKTIKIFIKHNIFIGKDQNLFAYVSYLNPTIAKIVYSGKWYYFKLYLS